MSAPPVPTSRIVATRRGPRARAIARADSRVPPVSRLIRARSRRLPAEGGGVVERARRGARATPVRRSTRAA